MGQLFSTFKKLYYTVFTDYEIIDEPLVFTQVPNPYLSIDHANFLSVISYNIPTKGTHYSHEWKYRRTAIADFVTYHKPDIISFQEPHQYHTKDLHALLSAEYRCFGIGREHDGTSEFQPIFWRADVLDEIDKGSFWLSETPHIPGSVSWNSACVRHCVWMLLKHKQTQVIMLVINTHWDHVSGVARKQSGILMKMKIEELLKDMQCDSSTPVIVCGDFNEIRASAGIANLQLNSAFQEENYSTDLGYGVQFISDPHSPTFIGWDGKRRSIIDFVFYKNIRCIQYGTMVDAFLSGRTMSDHRPVFSRFLLKAN